MIISLEDSYFLDALKLATSLRNKLDNFSVQFLGKEKNLKSLLKKANKKNTDFMVIIGKKEIDSNSYTLKNLPKNLELQVNGFEALINNLNENL